MPRGSAERDRATRRSFWTARGDEGEATAAVVLGGVAGEVAREQLLETRGNAKTSSFVAIISAMMLAGKSSSGSADSFATTRLSCS